MILDVSICELEPDERALNADTKTAETIKSVG
jgi:hypothetical protein